MMGSGAPMPDSADFDGVFALIALAADPKGFQARITELQRLTVAANTVIAEADKTNAAAKSREAAVAAREKAVSEKMVSVNALQDDLQNRAKKAAQREAEIAAMHKAAIVSREEWEAEEERRRKDVILGERNFQDSIRDRLTDLARRESVASAATEAAETLMAAATKLKEDYEARLAKMVAMAQGVKA
jgi:hypothetical protein